MQTKIKICGIQDLQTAKFCEKNGVDFIGFNFVKTSKRYIDPKFAFEICKDLKKIKKVGIFVDEKIEEVNEIANKLNLDYVQLHGQEDNGYIDKCSTKVIKAFRMNKNFIQQDLDKFRSENVKYFLFDGQRNGEMFDHSILKNLKISKPFFVAGGINSENVLDLVEKYKPYGVDIASGVEDEDGRKDFGKIETLLFSLELLPKNKTFI